VKDAIRSVFALLIATFFFMLGQSMLGTLLTIQSLQKGASELEAGMIMSVFFAGLILATFFVNKVILRFGHIRCFAFVASLFSVAILAHGFWDNFYSWLGLRLIEGMCMGGLFVCIESWLNVSAKNEVRGKVLSAYMCVIYISEGGGQLLLNVGDANSFAMLAFISITLSLALLPVVLTKMKEPQVEDHSYLSINKMISISPVGIFVSFIGGLLVGGIYALGPIYADKLGYDLADTTILMAAIILGGLFLQWPVGAISDRMDRRYVMIFAFSAIVLMGTLIASFDLTFWVLIAAISLIGGFSFAIYPLGNCHTNDYAKENEIVPVAAGLILLFSGGAVLGPFAGSLMMEQWGAKGFPLFFIFFSVISIVFTLYRIAIGRKSKESKEHYAFPPVPLTAQISETKDEIDPAVFDVDSSPVPDKA
jgi:MFS family permease